MKYLPVKMKVVKKQLPTNPYRIVGITVLYPRDNNETINVVWQHCLNTLPKSFRYGDKIRKEWWDRMKTMLEIHGYFTDVVNEYE